MKTKPGFCPEGGRGGGITEVGTQERRVLRTDPEAGFEKWGLQVFTGQSQVRRSLLQLQEAPAHPQPWERSLNHQINSSVLFLIF